MKRESADPSNPLVAGAAGTPLLADIKDAEKRFLAGRRSREAERSVATVNAAVPRRSLGRLLQRGGVAFRPHALQNRRGDDGGHECHDSADERCNAERVRIG